MEHLFRPDIETCAKDGYGSMSSPYAYVHKGPMWKHMLKTDMET